MACDGNNDCQSGSDEKQCKIDQTLYAQWKFPWDRPTIVDCYDDKGNPRNETTFSCDNGPCIDIVNYCDGVKDCPYGK